MRGLCVSLFDFTGNILKPWNEAGYACVLVDKRHPAGWTARDDERLTLGIDLYEVEKISHLIPTNLGPIKFACAFPPCDHLATTGRSWFVGKGLHALAKSIELFAKAAEYCEQTAAPYFIENPVSTISTYWRKSDYTFSPDDFTGFCEDDNYKKTTCLWTGGGFIMPPEYKVTFKTHGKWLGEPDKNRIRHMSGKDASQKRAVTPKGFSRAVFLANNRDDQW